MQLLLRKIAFSTICTLVAGVMQRLLIYLFMFILVAEARAQKFDAFEIENDQLVWRYNYTYEGEQDSLRREVVSMLKSKIFTQQVVRNELGYNGEIRHYQVDCQRYGRKYGNTPLIYWSGEWSGKFIIEVFQNGYRVTIYGLYFENEVQPTSRHQNKSPRKGFYVSEVWKKGSPVFRKNKLVDMSLMSQSLRDAFDIRQYTTLVN